MNITDSGSNPENENEKIRSNDLYGGSKNVMTDNLEPISSFPTFNSSSPASFSASSELSRLSVLQGAKERMTTLIPVLYQRLNSVCSGGDVEGIIRDRILLEELQGQRWIWVGDNFVTPNRVAFSSTVNAAPFLHELPQSLRVYGKLLNPFKIKPAFTPRDYIQVLREMYDASCIVPTRMIARNCENDSERGSGVESEVERKKILDRKTEFAESHSTQSHTSADTELSVYPLSDSRIDLAVSLVTLLSAEGGVNANVLTIYAPDSTGRLAHSITLIDDDIPWLSGAEYTSARIGCRFIHPNVSSLVSQKLGL